MSRAALGLAGLLILQLGLVLLVHRPESMLPATPEADPLLPAVAEGIDEIQVNDDRDQEALLVKQDGRWVLPDMDDLPADSGKIERLLAAITGTDQGRPVAGSVAARQRFQVAAYHFRRRITFIGDGELLGTIYLGTSPGFRKVHARNDAQDEVYTIEYNAHDAPAVSQQWLDRKLLQIAQPTSIRGPGFQLAQQQGEWRNAAGEAPEPRELDALLLVLGSIQVEGIAGEDEQRSLSEQAPSLSLRIEDASGPVDLELFDLAGYYAAYSSRHALFFTLSAYDYDRLTSIDATLLAGTGATR